MGLLSNCLASSQVINSFCQQEDIDVKMKVMTRLQNITYLHTLLEEALSGNPVIAGLSQSLVIPVIFKMMCVLGTPGFVPPVANFDGESPDVPSPGPAAPANKAKKGDIAELNVFDAIRLLQVA